jgi:uncharacterized protein
MGCPSRRPAAVEHARILKDLTPTLALEAQRILLCGAQCAASVRARPGLKYYAGDKDQEQKDLRYSLLFYDESVVRARFAGGTTFGTELFWRPIGHMDATLLDFLAAGLVICLGSTLQASTGFGAGLVVVPLLALIHLEFVPGPVIFASLGLSLLMTLVGRRAINRMHLHTVSVGLIIGMLIGAVSLSRLAPDHLGTMFGALILLAVFLTTLGVKLPFTASNSLMAGAVSGFMGMTAAVGAPILALLYQYEKGNTLRATLAFLYLFSSVGMLLLLHLMGRFQWHELLLGLGLLPGIPIGYALASRVAPHVDRGYSRYAVLIISTLSALALIVKSLDLP